jgi:branched-chain amino acid transport system substrate-binding protein
MGHWSPKAKWPGAKEFFDAYVAEFKKRPDPLDSVLAYVSCQIMQESIEKVGLDHEKLREYISTTKFSTINGPIKFAGSENTETPSMILQWQKDNLEIIWPDSAATAKPLFPKPPWPK